MKRNRERQEKYRSNPKNKEKIKKRQEDYRSNPKNKVKKNAYQRKYRSNPKNKAQEKREEYLLRPDVRTREKARSSSYNRQYYDEKKDNIGSRSKIRYNEKRDEINASRRISRNKKYEILKNSLFKILGGQKCIQCGFSNPNSLDIDHIPNTGYLDKKRFKRKDTFYRHYINHPIEAIDNLQILCSNCNQIKRNITIKREKYHKLKNSLFEILGGQKCIQCGFSNPKALQIDHIHNTGNLDKKRFSGDSLHRYYIKHPIEAIDNLQVLCANCNQIKARTS